VTSLYEHAGADEGLHRLEEIFYSKVLTDRILKSLFTERRPHHVERLTWFTSESFGGPYRFTRKLGFQHVIDVHRHLKITDEQRERFVALYIEALDEAGPPATSPSAKRVDHMSSSARGSRSRTRGPRPTSIFIRFARFRDGSGQRRSSRPNGADRTR
jgi:hemoglobin